MKPQLNSEPGRPWATNRATSIWKFFLWTSLMSWLAFSTSATQTQNTLTIDQQGLYRLQEVCQLVLIRAREGEGYVDCPTVNVPIANELAVAIAQAGYDLDRYKSWLEEAGSRARSQSRTAYEERYRRYRDLVDQTKVKLVNAQKVFYNTLEGVISPEPYPSDPVPKLSDFNLALRYLDSKLPSHIGRIQEALDGFVILAHKRAELKLEKTTFEPGEAIEVEFTASKCRYSYGWIGIVPSSIPHSKRSIEQQTMPYQLLQNRPSTMLTIKAPDAVGNYDLRQYDSRQGLEEVAFVSFTVKKEEDPNDKETQINLTGNWIATGYTCRGNEPSQKVRITQQADSVTAVKITGDDCIEAGQITWQGTIREGTFPVRIQVVNNAGGKKFFTNATVRVESRDRLVLSTPWWSVTYSRSSTP